jgi:hypothetical protein
MKGILSPGLDVLPEVPPLTIFHVYATFSIPLIVFNVMTFFFIICEKLHNIWMIQVSQSLTFSCQTCDVSLRIIEVWGKSLPQDEGVFLLGYISYEPTERDLQERIPVPDGRFDSLYASLLPPVLAHHASIYCSFLD